MSSVRSEASATDSKPLTEIIKENLQEQQRVNRGVILSGFTARPDEFSTVTNFVELFNLSMSVVNSYHHFERRISDHHGKSTKVFHHLVINFFERTVRNQILDNVEAMELPIKQGQLVDTTQRNVAITCGRRLTRFNIAVEKHLKTLQSRQIIEDFKLGDEFHLFKLHHDSEWIQVTHLGVLDPFISEMKASKLRNLQLGDFFVFQSAKSERKFAAKSKTKK